MIHLEDNILEKWDNYEVRIHNGMDRIFKVLDDNDIKATFFIVGYIGETLQQMEETVRFAQSIDVDWAEMKVFTPIVGSDMYEQAINNGYLDPGDPYFEEHVYNRSNIGTDEFTAKQVKDVQYNGNIRVNFLNNRDLRKGNYVQAEQTFGKLMDMNLLSLNSFQPFLFEDSQ